MVAITSIALSAVAAAVVSAAPYQYTQTSYGGDRAEAAANAVAAGAIATASAAAEASVEGFKNSYSYDDKKGYGYDGKKGDDYDYKPSKSWGYGKPSKTHHGHKQTHTITAGVNGLNFANNNIRADKGDVIEVHYLPKKHSFTQSSFDEPCVPLSDWSVNSGFVPTDEGEAPEVFQFTVKNTEPFWYYCAQTNGNHCQQGMVGVINEKKGSHKNLDAFKKLANETEPPSKIGPNVVGGKLVKNPSLFHTY